MTESRVEKYGHVVFKVCKIYIDKRMAYLADRQAAEMMSKEQDFEQMAAAEPSQNGGWISKPTP